MPPSLSVPTYRIKCVRCRCLLPRNDESSRGQTDRVLCTPCFRDGGGSRHATDLGRMLVSIPRRRACSQCLVLRPAALFANQDGPDFDRCKPCRTNTKHCSLCLLSLPQNLFLNHHGLPGHSRCHPCRKRERCSRCEKILKHRHFIPVNMLKEILEKNNGKVVVTSEVRANLTRTCDKCREKPAQRAAARRIRAAAAGTPWCSHCQKEVTAQDLTNENGVRNDTCNSCRAKRSRPSRLTAQPPHTAAIPDDEIVHDPPEGVRTHQIDEFDQAFGTGDDLAGIDLPDDSAVSAAEKKCIENFLRAEQALKREVCQQCNECDWDMKLREGKCHRCRADKNPVKKFCLENNVNPSDVPLALQGLTDLEEMMISKNLPMMQVRYTKGRQLCYKDHICNFIQDISNITSQLPRLPEECDIVIIRRDGVDLTRHIDFVVRREKVLAALREKIRVDPSYADIRLDDPIVVARLAQLPQNGSMADRIPTCRAGVQNPAAPEAAGPNEAAAIDDEEDDPLEGEVESSGLLNLGTSAEDEVQAIRQETAPIFNAPIRYEQRHVVQAPDLGNTPISESTPGYITRCFPSLFPDGSGDFHQPRLQKLELSEYFAHLMRYKDGRFARHRRFPWFAFNTLQRHRARSQAKVYIKQDHDAGQLTAADIRAQLEQGDNVVANNMIRYGAQLRGTRAYWSARRAELMDTINILGSPHAFITLSAADLQWPGLHQHMPPECNVPEGDARAERSQRRLALNKNPHIAASYLDKRVQLFMKHVICPVLGVKHFWYRYEWQARGSGHIHGFLWLKDAPNPDDIDWNHAKKDNSIISDDQQQKIREFIRFWDKLITAKNPFPREDENAPLLGQHPSSLRTDTLKHDKAELADLLNWVQRHTKCQPGYCQVKRKVPGVAEPVIACRFDYPKRVRDEVGWGIDSKQRVHFEPARNDPLLNSHNRAIMMGWRANTDLKPVLSKESALQYIAKYATKAESNAPAFPALLTDILSHVDDNVPAQNVCQKLLNKMIGERTYPAQETAHLLLSIPLVHSTFSFTTLTLSKAGTLREIRADSDPDGEVQPETERTVTGSSWMQRYRERPSELEDLSMHQVFERYSWYGKKWVKRKDSTCVIVRTYPRLSPNPEDPNYDDYCRVKILLHHPFRDPIAFLSAQVDDEALERSWSDLFMECQRDGHQHPADTLRDWKEECSPPEDDEDDDEDIQEDIAQYTEEDWQIYQQMFAGSAIPEFGADDLGNRPVDEAWNTDDARTRWNDVDSMAGYIQEQKNDDGFLFHDDETPVDLTTLANEQRDIFELYVETYRRILRGEEVNQVLLNIDGTAGCGKTYLIRAICQELRRLAHENDQPDPIRVIAPSGVAALNINGRTIHSALGIPASNGSFIPLTGKPLATLQQGWKGVLFLIIDEKSMLGQRMFAKMDARLRQMQPAASDKVLGGFHVSLIGDFAQLPPVKDRALYSSPQPSTEGSVTQLGQLSRDGHTVYKAFSRSFRLRIVHRQQGDSPAQVAFRSLLKNASNGGMQLEDWHRLQTRYKENLTVDEQNSFKDSVCLFTTAEVVAVANITQLAALDSPCARILAKNDGRNAKNAPSDECGGLESEFVLARGAKVMVTRNLWQNKGLVNGTTGTVVDVVWSAGSTRSDLPLAVLIECETYTGPTLWRTEPRPSFPDGVLSYQFQTSRAPSTFKERSAVGLKFLYDWHGP